jgi:hypothetical protein
MGDVVFHSRLRDAVEVVVDDDISLIEFHGANLQKNSASQAFAQVVDCQCPMVLPMKQP